MSTFTTFTYNGRHFCGNTATAWLRIQVGTRDKSGRIRYFSTGYHYKLYNAKPALEYFAARVTLAVQQRNKCVRLTFKASEYDKWYEIDSYRPLHPKRQKGTARS